MCSPLFHSGPDNAGVSGGQIFNLRLWISCLLWGGGQIMPPGFLSSQPRGLPLRGAGPPWGTGECPGGGDGLSSVRSLCLLPGGEGLLGLWLLRMPSEGIWILAASSRLLAIWWLKINPRSQEPALQGRRVSPQEQKSSAERAFGDNACSGEGSGGRGGRWGRACHSFRGLPQQSAPNGGA